MFGVIQFGRAYSTQLRLNYAAREAAREVALGWNDPGLLLPLVDLAESTVAETFEPPLPTITGPVTCAPDADATVVLQHSVSIVIPGFERTVPLEAKAQMPCES